MKCVICKHGETESGKATITLERDEVTLVVKGVPAQVCQNCGEEYVGQDTVKELERPMDEACKTGVQVEVREYAVADSRLLEKMLSRVTKDNIHKEVDFGRPEGKEQW